MIGQGSGYISGKYLLTPKIAVADSRTNFNKTHFAKRRMTDGTSQIELHKALSTFLNRTGAGDYELPQLTGGKIVEGNRKNDPKWSFKKRTKMTWFPGRDVEFQASSSPPATKYSPKTDRDYKN